MKRFKFRLESLYNLRREEERQALFAVQELRQKELFLHRSLHEMAEERKVWIRRYNSTSLSPIQDAAHEVFLIEQYLIALDRKEKHVRSELRSLEQEIEKALFLVQKAYQARKQVEYLRDRQRTDFQQEAERSERRAIDEYTALRFSYEGKEAQA